jgi:hypothetical protein
MLNKLNNDHCLFEKYLGGTQVNEHVVGIDTGLEIVHGNNFREEFDGAVVVVDGLVRREHCIAYDNVRLDACDAII